MRGAWGIYPSLPSGRIIVSDRTNGLFLFDFREDIFTPNNSKELILFPNPTEQGNTIQFRLGDTDINGFEYKIIDVAGKTILSNVVLKQNYAEINAILSVGIYNLQVMYEDYLGETIELHEKIMVY